MYGIFIVLHVLISIGLVLVVLMQSGKGGGLSGAFGGGGGGGSQTLFGGTGAATFLNKATIGLAVAFMVSSLLLAVMGGRVGRGARSVLDETTAGQIPVAPQTIPGTGTEAGLPGTEAGLPGTEPGTGTVLPEGETAPPGTETEGFQLPVAPAAGEEAGETGTETPEKAEPESPDEGSGTP